MTVLHASFLGADLPPFDGDRTVELLALPADARVLSATAVVRPDWPAGSPFQETITPDVVSGPGNGLIVDFHARRRVLALGVSGSGQTQVYVDLAGMWMAIDPAGAPAPPGDKPFWDVSDGALPMPAVETSRVRLVPKGTTITGVTSATLSCVPANVTLRLDGQGPFLARLGDLTGEAPAEFTAALAAVRPDLPVENGHRVLPITMHSDGLARLALTVDLTYVRDRSLLPDAVSEIELPFAYERTPVLNGGPLPAVELVVGETAGESRGRVTGQFDETRIVLGTTEPAAVKGPQRIGAGLVQAQPILVTDPIQVDGIDVRVEPLTDDAAVSLTVLGDADGKPWGDPVIPAVRAAVPRDRDGGYRWFSLPLLRTLTLDAGPAGQPARYWLIATAEAGVLNWATTTAAPGAELYRSEDAWLTWQPAGIARSPGPLTAAFRLRSRPARFTMPIDLVVGDGPHAEVLPLDAFDPAARVDVPLDALTGLAGAINGFTAATGPRPCPEAEHLTNGDLSRFVSSPAGDPLPAEWSVTGVAEPAVLPGRELQSGVKLSAPENGGGALSQVTAVSPGCTYVLDFLAAATGEGVEAQLLWRGSSCAGDRLDRLEVRREPPEGRLPPPLLHRITVPAPSAAAQVEVRFVVPPQVQLVVGGVSFRASAELLVNPDLRDGTGWDTPAAGVTSGDSGAVLGPGQTEIRVVQRVGVAATTPHFLELAGRALPPGESRVELAWLDQQGVAIGLPVVQRLPSLAFDRYRVETVSPVTAAVAEISLVVPPEAVLMPAVASLRARPRRRVPVSFRAQSPGTLLVSQAGVSVDEPAPEAPPVPTGGLCPPTAPGEEPGPVLDNCHCGSCGLSTPLLRAEPMVSEAGRAVRRAVCVNCGAAVFALGGALSADAKPLPPARDLSAVFLQRAELPALNVDQIGARRAAELAALGIRTVAEVAAAPVDRLAQVSSLSPKGAEDVRRMANRFLFGVRENS